MPSKGAFGRLRTPEGQSLRYLLAGTWNTVFGYGVFVVLHTTLGRRVHYLVVLAIAQVIAVLNAFVVQRRFVFRVQGRLLGDLLRFSSVYAGVYAVNAVALPILVEGMGAPVVPAQGIFTLLGIAVSYVLHHRYSFRR